MSCFIEIKAENLWGRDLIIFVKQESAQNVIVRILFGHTDFLLNLLEHTKMRIRCILNEAIKKDSHFISLKLVLAHNLEELISSIL